MSTGTPYTKFAFDTEFFEVVAGQPGAGTISTTSSRSMEAIKQEAYAAGLAEGQKQAQADLAQLQQHLQNTIVSLQKSLAEREEQITRQCLGLLGVTITHLLGHAGSHYGAELLEHHLRTLLPLIKTDESLTLRIHPAARGYHEKLGLPQASILGLPMHVVPDATLGPTDAIIEWANGGVESKASAHLQHVAELLAGAGAPPVGAGALPNLSATPTPPPAATAAPADAGTAASPEMSAAEQAAKARAAALLGDDDLVDALKS